MFKHSKLAAAIITAVATTGAHAVNVSNDGTGEVLIFPYYNTNNNFVTQLSLTNTTNLYKAVKVRFRESNESNDTLDFNLYMSPQDQWTAVVRRNPNTGRANIITTDETCTYPSKALLQAGADFIDIYTAVDPDDTSEGYIEVIEMGVIADGTGPAVDNNKIAEIDASGTANGAVGAGDTSIPAGLLHDADGMPADCSVVQAAWTAGATAAGAATVNGFMPGAVVGVTTDGNNMAPANADPYLNTALAVLDPLNAGLVAPSGGLSGYAILLNLNNGAAFVADPAVVDNVASLPTHFRSDDTTNYLFPSLASGDVTTSNVVQTDGTLLAVQWALAAVDPGSIDDISPNPPRNSGTNIMPISHVLAATGFSNDFFVEAGTVNGATDWVVTFPMKKHGVFNSEAYTAQVNVCDTDDNGVGDNAAAISCPYTSLVGGAANAGITATGVNTTAGFDGDDVEFTFTYYDREEQDFTPAPGGAGFSPVIITQPTAARLTREVNVLAFAEAGGATQAVLGTPADNVFNIDLEAGWDQGWMRATFDPKYQLAVTDTVVVLTNSDAPAPLVELFGGTEDSATVEPDVIVNAETYTLAGGIVAADNVTINGVPTVGFAAIRGDVSAAGSSGEVVQHTFYRD